MAFDLDGAVAVLTGAGSGIGRATAMSLAARGVRIAASDLDSDRAEETSALITATGGEAIGVKVDVTEQEDLEELRNKCLEWFGCVDIVVNNVGVVAMGAPESLPLEAWTRVLDLNVLSVARSNHVFLPQLIEQERGHVVNMASVHGLLSYGFDRLPYLASKHARALVGVSEALAIYLGQRGIGVTCVCPSRVPTHITEQTATYGEAPSPMRIRHQPVDAAVVGELVVDAVTTGKFLVVIAPELYQELRERAADPEAYVQRLIDEASRNR
jgi:NAD(P)-dependent dehydrogenase (short-subunit alcohol dehydrogenase family)